MDKKVAFEVRLDEHTVLSAGTGWLEQHDRGLRGKRNRCVDKK